MTENNPVVWFEIPVLDLDRAVAFYETVFSCKMSMHDMGPLKMAWFPSKQGGPGSTGALVQAEAYKPSYEGSLVYLAVEDIDSALQKITSMNGKILHPKRGIGEYGFVAHFEDSEGNRVAVHSSK